MKISFQSLGAEGAGKVSVGGKENIPFLIKKLDSRERKKKIKNLIGFFTLWILCNFCRYLHLFSSPVRFGVAKLKQKLAEPLSLSKQVSYRSVSNGKS